MTEERFSIKPFTSATGYIPWKAKITAYLKSKKLDKALENPPAQDAAEADKTVFREQDNTAKAILLNSLVEDEVIRVMNEETAKSMLDLLEQYHTSKSGASLALALTKHQTIKMAEGGDLIKYLGEYEQIISEINPLGGGLSENQIA